MLRPWITTTIKKIDVGEDYCIPPTFRDEHQFNVPTSNYRLDMALVIDSSDWTLSPHHGDLRTLARSSQAYSVTHRRGISPSPKCLKCKRSIAFFIQLSLAFSMFKYIVYYEMCCLSSTFCLCLFIGENFL